MYRIFLREGFLYEESVLYSECRYSDSKEERESFKGLLTELKRNRLIKSRRQTGSREYSEDDASLISEDDIDYYEYVGEETRTGKIQYLFKFVGVIVYGDRIIYVYPKYIESSNYDYIYNEMKQIVNVIRKYQYKSYNFIIPQFLEELEDGDCFSELALDMYLLFDYSENGLYCDSERVVELNGDGEINWDKTIETITPIVKNNRPFYYDAFVSRSKVNYYSYFVRLHRYILTEVSHQFEETGLVDLFCLPRIEFSDENIDDFGDVNYIYDSLLNALDQQYDDRKRAVLHALSLYIKSKYLSERCLIESKDSGLQFFGSRAFHRIWEEVINSVYVSHKQMEFGDIQENDYHKLDYALLLPNGNSVFVQRTDLLNSCIEKPEWYIKDTPNHEPQMYLPSSSFIPDFLRFSEKDDCFYIMDAKYYLPKCTINCKNERKIEKQPGVEDVAKQYLYYFAFKKLLSKNRITNIENYFVMPTENEDHDAGYVRLGFLEELLQDRFNIRIKKFNAHNLFCCYLQDVHRDISEIREIDRTFN